MGIIKSAKGYSDLKNYIRNLTEIQSEVSADPSRFRAYFSPERNPNPNSVSDLNRCLARNDIKRFLDLESLKSFAGTIKENAGGQFSGLPSLDDVDQSYYAFSQGLKGAVGPNDFGSEKPNAKVGEITTEMIEAKRKEAEEAKTKYEQRKIEYGQAKTKVRFARFTYLLGLLTTIAAAGGSLVAGYYGGLALLTAITSPTLILFPAAIVGMFIVNKFMIGKWLPNLAKKLGAAKSDLTPFKEKVNVPGKLLMHSYMDAMKYGYEKAYQEYVNLCKYVNYITGANSYHFEDGFTPRAQAPQSQPQEQQQTTQMQNAGANQNLQAQPQPEPQPVMQQTQKQDQQPAAQPSPQNVGASKPQVEPEPALTKTAEPPKQNGERDNASGSASVPIDKDLEAVYNLIHRGSRAARASGSDAAPQDSQNQNADVGKESTNDNVSKSDNNSAAPMRPQPSFIRTRAAVIEPKPEEIYAEDGKQTDEATSSDEHIEPDNLHDKIVNWFNKTGAKIEKVGHSVGQKLRGIFTRKDKNTQKQSENNPLEESGQTAFESAATDEQAELVQNNAPAISRESAEMKREQTAEPVIKAYDIAPNNEVTAVVPYVPQQTSVVPFDEEAAKISSLPIQSNSQDEKEDDVVLQGERANQSNGHDEKPADDNETGNRNNVDNTDVENNEHENEGESRFRKRSFSISEIGLLPPKKDKDSFESDVESEEKLKPTRVASGLEAENEKNTLQDNAALEPEIDEYAALPDDNKAELETDREMFDRVKEQRERVSAALRENAVKEASKQSDEKTDEEMFQIMSNTLFSDYHGNFDEISPADFDRLKSSITDDYQRMAYNYYGRFITRAYKDGRVLKPANPQILWTPNEDLSYNDLRKKKSALDARTQAFKNIVKQNQPMVEALRADLERDIAAGAGAGIGEEELAARREEVANFEESINFYKAQQEISASEQKSASDAITEKSHQILDKVISSIDDCISGEKTTVSFKAKEAALANKVCDDQIKEISSELGKAKYRKSSHASERVRLENELSYLNSARSKIDAYEIYKSTRNKDGEAGLSQLRYVIITSGANSETIGYVKALFEGKGGRETKKSRVADEQLKLVERYESYVENIGGVEDELTRQRQMLAEKANLLGQASVSEKAFAQASLDKTSKLNNETMQKYESMQSEIKNDVQEQAQFIISFIESNFEEASKALGNLSVDDSSAKAARLENARRVIENMKNISNLSESELAERELTELGRLQTIRDLSLVAFKDISSSSKERDNSFEFGR